MKVKEIMEKEDFKCFVPMKYVEHIKNGQRKKKLVPVISNLIFVYTTKETIDDLKKTSFLQPLIRYVMDKERRTPIIVPERQMNDFIAVAGRPEEQITYLTTEEVHIKKGDKVRVNSGIWKGVEGMCVDIKGGTRVVVSIEGLLAVATASLHPSMLDKIN